ncbi:MAG: putative efflux protein family [Cyanobacteria bacterium RYN_339]|nr:putative efflux protein family [Cyanobacteria bacterium RYN_339]
MATAVAPAATTSWRGIWDLAWPLVLTMVLNALIGLLDAAIAGRYDAASQAAVGMTNQIIFLINAAVTAASVGCQALVARFVGADDWDQAGLAAQQTLILGIGVTIAIMVPLWLFAPQFYAAMGASPEVVRAGTSYLRTVLTALLPMDVVILVNSVFRARGRTTALLVSNLVESGCWALGSLGLGLYAGLGLPGLALAFVAGKLAGMGVTLGLFRRSRVYRFMPAGWRPQAVWFRRILVIGLPSGIQVLIRNAGVMALFGVLNKLPGPTEAVAAFVIGSRIEAMAFLPVFALNFATATLVGQNLGAGRPDDAAHAAWRVALVGVGIMSVFGLLFVALADPLAGAFTQDPGVRALAASYLRVVGLSEPFLGLVMVLNGGLQGAGATQPPLLFTFSAQICLRVPLAYGLAVLLHWGPTGVWWAFTVSIVVQATLVTTYFVRGKWKTKEV